MQLFIKDDEGNIIGTYMGGVLYSTFGVDKAALAFELYKLQFSLMQSNTGVNFGLSSNPLTDQAPDDVEGGTP